MKIGIGKLTEVKMKNSTGKVHIIGNNQKLF